MKRFMKTWSEYVWFVCVVVVAGTLSLAIAAGGLALQTSGHTLAEQATVMVSDEGGHGSGVVIGRNLILTAAHVVVKKTAVQITLSNGKKTVGHTLWAGSGNHDVALVEAETGDVRPARLRCDTVPAQTRVFTYGYPLDAQKVTFHGNIASPVSPSDPDMSAGSVFLDMTVLPGNSGGGVWDEDGRLVGIADAVLLARVVIGIPISAAAMTGLSVMVGGPEICKLLGRD